MSDKSQSKLASRTTKSLLSESGQCFGGTFGFLVLLSVGGAFQRRGSFVDALYTIGSLLFILYFSLRFFCVLKEIKRRDE
ncbi:MAG: hypothetical protein PHP93_05430 [Kiritimatiellales bacterium]|nr:hypothetical protein [Kiritimatiellales bacterium]